MKDKKKKDKKKKKKDKKKTNNERFRGPAIEGIDYNVPGITPGIHYSDEDDDYASYLTI